jgi:hypothetical protein
MSYQLVCWLVFIGATLGYRFKGGLSWGVSILYAFGTCAILLGGGIYRADR